MNKLLHRLRELSPNLRKFITWSVVYLFLVILIREPWLLIGELFIFDMYLLKKRGLVRFVLMTFLLVLFVFWIGSFWWLLFTPLLYDIYVSKRLSSRLLRFRDSLLYRWQIVYAWVDAILFAVIVASFLRAFFMEAYVIPTPSMEKTMMTGDYLLVNKFAYGVRMPITPIAFPLVHNLMPFTESVSSFWSGWERSYDRIAGYTSVKRGDIIVFNFPLGDTVAMGIPQKNYHELLRQFTSKYIHAHPSKFGKVVYRPIDKRDNYIKRCVGLPGDEIRIDKGTLFVNGEELPSYEDIRYKYWIKTKGQKAISRHVFEKLGLSLADREGSSIASGVYLLPLTEKNVDELRNLPVIEDIERLVDTSRYVFPDDPENFAWTLDNVGPLIVPKKGETVRITPQNIALYDRIINVYEKERVEVLNREVYINGEQRDNYTFKMDYYWAMGDNRHNSLDSRYWGFVPEDHLVGQAAFIFMSKDPEKGLFSGIRWSRLFKVLN